MALFIRLLIYAFILGILTAGCSDRYIVMSSQYAMHAKSGKIYPMKMDSTLEVYDHFKIKRSDGSIIILADN